MLEASPSGMSGTYDHLEQRTAKLEYISDLELHFDCSSQYK